MPELPEVESLRRILARTAIGRTIVPRANRRQEFATPRANRFFREYRGPPNHQTLAARKILIVEFDGDDVLLVHLGMSGSLTHRRANFLVGEFDPRHDHLDFSSTTIRAWLQRSRRFGMVRLIARAMLASTAELKGLGPNRCRASSTPLISPRRPAVGGPLLKTCLWINGSYRYRNIYAAEILFRAGVRPTRRAAALPRPK